MDDQKTSQDLGVPTHNAEVPLSVDTGKAHHSPVSRLRNPRRVLNHMDLIQRKLNIGRRWGLVSTVKGEPAPATEFLADLCEGPSSLRRVLHEIAARSGIGTDVLCDDLLNCYPTGLLEFHPTDVCDLDCVDCHYRNKGNATVRFSHVADALRKLAPQAITITGGGEPNVYRSEGKKFPALVAEIKKTLPSASLGLINNNSHVPPGDWTEAFEWQRTSIDAATAETFLAIKRRPLFETVVDNVKLLLNKSVIPYVGVGFLFRRENAHEIALFLNQWYDWSVGQPARIQRRFNIQFRPISSDIQDMQSLARSGASYPDDATHATLRGQVVQVQHQIASSPSFGTFVDRHTNFASYFGTERSLDSSLFTHSTKPFDHCYNALCHRVLRATGEEYPDFLLCNQPELALGNALHGDAGEEMLRVALMEFYFFNRLGPHCNPEECRQGWVSSVVETESGHQRPPTTKIEPIDLFF